MRSDEKEAEAKSRYLTTEEAGKEVRLSPRTLEKMRVQGDGPRFRKHGRNVVYARADLDAWSDARTFGMTSDPGFNAAHSERS